MREEYGLTPETDKVLTDNVKPISLEMIVSARWLYRILDESATDPFALFERLYAATVNANKDTSPWDNKLAAIRARQQKRTPAKPITECLTDSLHENADLATQFIEALRDGDIDTKEAEAIQPIIDKARATLELLETHLQFKRDVRMQVIGRHK